MDKINCHGSTPKQDLIDFVNKHKGKKINLHYENNLYDRWGDDDDYTYDTSQEEYYIGIINTIKTHYIHNITLID
mgnify:FL=1